MLAEPDIELKTAIQLILLASHHIMNEPSHSLKEIMRDGAATAATNEAIGLLETSSSRDASKGS